MNIRTLVISLYVMFIYWLSLQYTIFDTLFFPTLAAFCFLFISRTFSYSDLRRITFGAFLSSIIGTSLFYISPGVFSVFINAVLTIWLINKFKWNAPPIVAVGFIPFFSQSSHAWVIPLSVTGALSGLMLLLRFIDIVEQKFSLLLKKQDVG